VIHKKFNTFTINNLTTRHCAKPRNVSGNTLEPELKMISEEQKRYILQNKKWSFTVNDVFIRYVIFVPILLITFLIFTYIIRKFSRMIFVDFIIVGILLMCVVSCSFYCLKKIKSESKFEEINSGKTNSEIIESASNKWNDIKWLLKENNESIIVFSDIIVGFRQENIITIIRKSDCIFLINSRSNGNQPFTFWRNKENLTNLKSILNN
jgi:hypothetical protein